MSRPTVLDDVRRAEVLALASHGLSRRAIADYVGCAANTIANTAQRDPAFGQQLRLAAEHFVCRNIDIIQRHAAQSPKNAMWLLERNDPEHFARRSPHSITPAQQARQFQTWTRALVAAVPAEARAAVAQAAIELAATQLVPDLHADPGPADWDEPGHDDPSDDDPPDGDSNSGLTSPPVPLAGRASDGHTNPSVPSPGRANDGHTNPPLAGRASDGHANSPTLSAALRTPPAPARTSAALLPCMFLLGALINGTDTVHLDTPEIERSPLDVPPALRNNPRILSRRRGADRLAGRAGDGRHAGLWTPITTARLESDEQWAERSPDDETLHQLRRWRVRLTDARRQPATIRDDARGQPLVRSRPKAWANGTDTVHLDTPETERSPRDVPPRAAQQPPSQARRAVRQWLASAAGER